MSAKEKQATPQAAFVFLAPLTSKQPAPAGAEVLKARVCEFTQSDFASLRKARVCELYCMYSAKQKGMV